MFFENDIGESFSLLIVKLEHGKKCLENKSIRTIKQWFNICDFILVGVIVTIINQYY